MKRDVYIYPKKRDINVCMNMPEGATAPIKRVKRDLCSWKETSGLI